MEFGNLINNPSSNFLPGNVSRYNISQNLAEHRPG